jgi:hypothetical protein
VESLDSGEGDENSHVLIMHSRRHALVEKRNHGVERFTQSSVREALFSSSI